MRPALSSSSYGSNTHNRNLSFVLHRFRIGPNLLSAGGDHAKRCAWKVVAGIPCKRYILVHRSGTQFSNTNQFVHGVGIVGWAGRNYLFALTYIRVFDGDDFSTLKQATAATGEESVIARGLGLNPIHGPRASVS